MRTAIFIGLFLALPASALAQTREPFSVEALVANATAYVEARYTRSELPSALIADLTAAGFQCQHSGSGNDCTRSREAGGSCFDVTNVSITAEGVAADRNRLCMGAEE
ncbi:hypothetical protein [Terricaulis sp.]|uniref:hypothetical protein n=1 Tax=Terricaulis sp. TaxID=2768686 RepID=UPI002AC5611F|nr:hypothetical protein [Terricaulis sp.]MDZ4690453.1 hypothetical protein [Terricaulis sp.]